MRNKYREHYNLGCEDTHRPMDWQDVVVIWGCVSVVVVGLLMLAGGVAL